MVESCANFPWSNFPRSTSPLTEKVLQQGLEDCEEVAISTGGLPTSTDATIESAKM